MGTVLLFLSVSLFYIDVWFFTGVRGITSFFIIVLFSLSMLFFNMSTIDRLTIDRKAGVLNFQRHGVIKRQDKTFKLSQIKDLKLVMEEKGFDLYGSMVTYSLQATLISDINVELFKSYRKKTVRKNVVFTHLVHHVVRVYRPRL